MDRKFLAEKIRQLSDDKLKELLQLRSKGNHLIIALAEREAHERGISIDEIEPRIKHDNGEKTKPDEGINWMLVLAELLPNDFS